MKHITYIKLELWKINTTLTYDIHKIETLWNRMLHFLFDTVDDCILKLWSLTILMFDSQIAPDWRQARTLKKSIEDKITKGIDFSRLLIFPYPDLTIIRWKLNIFIH